MEQGSQMDLKGLLGAMEVARRLGINRKTLYRATQKGRIKPAATLAGRFRYHPTEVERFRQSLIRPAEPESATPTA